MNKPILHRKSIFDSVRRMIGRGFKQPEVDALDAAIDSAENMDQDCVPCLPSAKTTRSVSSAGIALIKRFEGCASLRADGLVAAYPDPATGGAPWTIGWGATGMEIDHDTLWTQEECDARLECDLARYSADVARSIGDAPTTQPQFDALVSFHYNTGAIARATLTKLHRAGDYDRSMREFQRWNKAGGRVLKGLTNRRMAEAQLYASGMPDAAQ